MFDTFFYQPILNLVIFLYNMVPGHDLGIAIILLTIIIKVLLLPLSRQSIKSQKSLQDLQPKVDELKKKYANNKEELGRAMMNLYKEHKVNPFSSCLPLLIQLPFLFAVFKVFRTGFENGTLDLVYSFIDKPEVVNTISIIGVDLGENNYIIAFLAGAAQFWQAKMMMAKKAPVKSPGAKDENMMAMMNKQMVYMMPLLTIWIASTFPSGLALYWLTTTVLTGVQQLFIFKKDKEKDNNKDIQSGENKTIEGEVVDKKD